MNNNIIPIIDDRLEDLLNDQGIDVSVRNDYSGRSMFGRDCFGIVIRDCNQLQLAAVMTFVFAQDSAGDGLDLLELFAAARTDNMGYDTIVYFPGWSLAANLDEIDD